jgi:hypothetical protein
MNCGVNLKDPAFLKQSCLIATFSRATRQNRTGPDPFALSVALRSTEVGKLLMR